MPSDDFCYRDADEGLRNAVCQPNAQAAIRSWCRDNPDKLRLALDWIFPQHKVYRDIVSLELDDLRRKEQEEKYKEIHSKITALETPHWTTTPGFWVGFFALILAGLAAWFAWLAIPPAERPYFRLPSSEQKSSSLTPKPEAPPPQEQATNEQ